MYQCIAVTAKWGVYHLCIFFHKLKYIKILCHLGLVVMGFMVEPYLNHTMPHAQGFFILFIYIFKYYIVILKIL